MKKIAFIISLVLCIQFAFAQTGQNPAGTNQNPSNMTNTSWDYGQQTQITVGEVPSPVNDAFKAKYPDQMSPTWYRGQSGFMVSYMDKSNMEQQVFYDRTGKMTRTAIRVKSSDLPATTTTYLQKTYPGKSYEKVYRVTTDGKDSYMIMVGEKWMTFDSNGNLVPAK